MRISRLLNKNRWALAIMFLGAILLSKASYIQAKAVISQLLIERAYNQQVANNQAKKPWPWADTHVSAKLIIKGKTDYVLAGASGRNLAFGPAHLSSSAIPGSVGNSVIAGHRDTHFAHLEHIESGEHIKLEKNGITIEYEVVETAIVNEFDAHILAPMDIPALTLITCYPFNDIRPNPKLRFVVRAIKIS